MIFAFNPAFTHVLLLRKSSPPWQVNQWNAPGGLVNKGETEIAGAAREMAEETQIIASPSKLVFVLRFACCCDYNEHEIAIYGIVKPLRELKQACGVEREPVAVFRTDQLQDTVRYVPHFLALTIDRMKQRQRHRHS